MHIKFSYTCYIVFGYLLLYTCPVLPMLFVSCFYICACSTSANYSGIINCYYYYIIQLHCLVQLALQLIPIYTSHPQYQNQNKPQTFLANI